MTLDPVSLIRSVGYVGVFSILFAESGIPFLFFLPGDSLLFAAGFLASQKILSFPLLIGGALIAAITGNLLGYEIGRRVGLKLFAKGDGKIIKKKHLDMTRSFYDRHGKMAVIMARFMPVVRTFTPFLAGIIRMDYKLFVTYTVVGAVAWVGGLSILGYVFGRMIPPDQIDRYLLPVIVAIIVISFLPSVWHFWQESKRAKE